MKTFTSSIVAFVGLLSITSAAPSVPSAKRWASVEVTLQGATPGSGYSIWVPLSGSLISTAAVDVHKESVSIVFYDHSVSECHFYGVDETTAAPVEANGQLGPPQTIDYVSCYAL